MTLQRKVASTVLAGAAVVALLGEAKADPTITSPTSGVVVSPGDELLVSVSIASGEIESVVLQGSVALRITEQEANASYRVRVPEETPQKDYFVIAYGFGETFEGVRRSDPILIRVQDSRVPARLLVEVDPLVLPFPGVQLPMRVIAEVGAAKLDVSNVATYTPADSGIAIVGAAGMVTAVGSGLSEIGISYNGVNASVLVAVGGGNRGDLDNDGDVDQSDLQVLKRGFKTVPVIASDARDLNGDGKIDGLDARVLVRLCTRARCTSS